MREDLRQVRLDKEQALREEGVAVRPDRFERTHTIAEVMALADGEQVRTAGRVMTVRKMGKLTFAHLQDIGGTIQIALMRDGLAADPDESRTLYQRFGKVDRWDFVGVQGELFRTRTGELTIRVSQWTFLGKALQPPPDKFKGLRDQEAAWRKRYVDLVANAETRERFRVRARVVRSLRATLDAAAFDEVETPVLCAQASGALARPFYSHHNALDMDVVLRIAPETYLKRLIVGGYDRVYEFARCFRNEGWSPAHLQEFTMLEFYAAYWNYLDNMDFTEGLVRNAVQAAMGGLVVRRGEVEIDFGGDWPRVSLRQAILDACGLDIDLFPTAADMRAEIARLDVDLDHPDAGRGSLIDQLYKRTARPKIVQPTFIVRHPLDLSPLARTSDDNPGTVDRFQLVVDGWEVINAYSELVDPVDQRHRLEEQSRLRADGDDEAMPLDEDYLRAMEVGMPPISGWGMGIERFVALLTDAANLRDVVWFPLMKPLSADEGEE